MRKKYPKNLQIEGVVFAEVIRSMSQSTVSEEKEYQSDVDAVVPSDHQAVVSAGEVPAEPPINVEVAEQHQTLCAGGDEGPAEPQDPNVADDDNPSVADIDESVEAQPNIQQSVDDVLQPAEIHQGVQRRETETEAVFGELSFPFSMTLEFGAGPIHLFGMDKQNPHIFSAVKADNLEIFAMNTYSIGMPMEASRNYFVAFMFVNNKPGRVELVTIPATESMTFPIPTSLQHWTRIDINSIRTSRWVEAAFSESFATKLLVTIESFKDETTLSWRRNDVLDNRFSSESLLGRRPRRGITYAPSTAAAPSPARTCKREREIEDKSKELEKLKTSFDTLKESAC